MDVCKSNSFLECNITSWIWRTVPIGLVITGTIGNLLNIAVLLRPRIWKISSTIFLLCLAVSDLFFLWTTVVPRIYEEINLVYLTDFNPRAFCRTQVWINHVFGGYSIWLLAALTVERTILSRSAVLVRRRRNAYVTCGVLFVICVLFPLHYFWSYHIQPQNVCHWKKGFGPFLSDTWPIVVLVVLNVVPMLIIILGNINIRMNIVRHKRRLISKQLAQKSNRNTDPEEVPQTRKHKDASRSSVTRMLLLISISLIMTTLPFTIYRCLWFQIDDSTLRAHAKRHLYDAVIEVILYCNFAFNFFLYFVSGSLFKEEWHKMVEEVRLKLSFFCSFRCLTANERQQENAGTFQGLEHAAHPV